MYMHNWQSLSSSYLFSTICLRIFQFFLIYHPHSYCSNVCVCRPIYCPFIVGGGQNIIGLAIMVLCYFNWQLIAEIFPMYPTALMMPTPLIAQVPRLYILVTWVLSSPTSIRLKWLQCAGMITCGQMSLIVKVSSVMIAKEQDTKLLSNSLFFLKVVHFCLYTYLSNCCIKLIQSKLLAHFHCHNTPLPQLLDSTIWWGKRIATPYPRYFWVLWSISWWALKCHIVSLLCFLNNLKIIIVICSAGLC